MPARPPRHVTFFDAYPHVYGGAERSTHLLAERLPELGYTVDVVLPREGVFANELRATGVEVTVISAPSALGYYGDTTRGRRLAPAFAALPRYWWELRRHLRRRAQLLHVCSQRAAILAGPAARLARVPVLWQVSVIERHRWVSLPCDALATRTVALSRAARAKSVRPWRSQLVVPMPIDKRFEAEHPVVPTAPPTVVTAGRLEPMKNLQVLIEAVALVRGTMPDVRLRVIGGVQEGYESYAEDLIRSCEALGIRDAVEFTGWCARPEDSWAGASVYVNTSEMEGLGLAIVEAMSCHLPVVFTTAIGLAEFVEDGRSALLVAPNDARATAAAISRVLRDPGLARRLGEEGRVVAGRFSLDRIATETVAVYEDMLKS